MSKQGKAIAMKALAGDIQLDLLKTQERLLKMNLFTTPALMIAAAAQAAFRIKACANIPHQHFNAKGQVDKRKVRRHERNIGMKPHTARILRPITTDKVDDAYMDMLNENHKKVSDAMCVRSELLGKASTYMIDGRPQSIIIRDEVDHG